MNWNTDSTPTSTSVLDLSGGWMNTNPRSCTPNSSGVPAMMRLIPALKSITVTERSLSCIFTSQYLLGCLFVDARLVSHLFRYFRMDHKKNLSRCQNVCVCLISIWVHFTTQGSTVFVRGHCRCWIMQALLKCPTLVQCLSEWILQYELKSLKKITEAHYSKTLV